MRGLYHRDWIVTNKTVVFRVLGGNLKQRWLTTCFAAYCLLGSLQNCGLEQRIQHFYKWYRKSESARATEHPRSTEFLLFLVKNDSRHGVLKPCSRWRTRNANRARTTTESERLETGQYGGDKTRTWTDNIKRTSLQPESAVRAKHRHGPAT